MSFGTTAADNVAMVEVPKRNRCWYQFRLRSLFFVITAAAILCALAKLLIVETDSRVVENALVGKMDTEVLAAFGKPNVDHVGYVVLELQPPASLPPGPIRTLIYDRMDGGTLRVWIKKTAAGWVCFESCWYGDGVDF